MDWVCRSCGWKNSTIGAVGLGKNNCQNCKRDRRKSPINVSYIIEPVRECKPHSKHLESGKEYRNRDARLSSDGTDWALSSHFVRLT